MFEKIRFAKAKRCLLPLFLVVLYNVNAAPLLNLTHEQVVEMLNTIITQRADEISAGVERGEFSCPEFATKILTSFPCFTFHGQALRLQDLFIFIKDPCYKGDRAIALNGNYPRRPEDTSLALAVLKSFEEQLGRILGCWVDIQG